MAIYRTGPLASGISGKVGGAVFVNAPGSKVIRRSPTTLTKRKSPPGPNQTPPRAALAIAQTGWTALTTASRTAWNTLASQINFPNRLGESRPIAGFQLYMKVNIIRTSSGISPMTGGPANSRPAGIASLGVVASLSAGLDITVTSPTGPTNRDLLIYGSLHWGSTPPKFYRDFRFLTRTAITKGVALDITSDWTPRFGPLRLGQHLAILVRMHQIDTWAGPPSTQPATVTA